MFVTALKSSIPIIQIKIEDPLYLEDIFKSTLNEIGKTFNFGMNVSGFLGSKLDVLAIPFSKKETIASIDFKILYGNLIEVGKSVVLINFESLVLGSFDAGILSTPPQLITKTLLESDIPERTIHKILPLLRGLTLKAVTEVCRIAMVIDDSEELTIASIQRAKQLLSPETKGLMFIKSDLDFYQTNPQLEEYLDLNEWFFLEGEFAKLTPRGLLFNGPPGVGKSQSAKYLSRRWKVPLYMFDIAATMNKYIGQSENNMAHALRMIDKEAPAILLLDEVEKLFNGTAEGTTQRMLGQLLWWLEEHRSKVFTIMTTNDRSKLPQELIRPGRIDAVMDFEGLTAHECHDFVMAYVKGYDLILTKKEVNEIITPMFNTLKSSTVVNSGRISHAEIVGACVNYIKKQMLKKIK